MSRMDVKRKLLLMNTYGSYWFMLPAEIREYILVLKRSQFYIEWNKRIQREKLCTELKDYHKLTIAWGLGFISSKFYYCDCRLDDRRCTLGQKHRKIFGMYYDEANVKKTVYLSNCFFNALQRVNHVKSFL